VTSVAVQHRHVRQTPGRAFARIAREGVLTLGAVLGCVCIAAAVAGVVLGVRPLVVVSGSMSPTIDAGALALARPTDAADLRAGDVVSVEAPNGTRVTHRIAAIARDGGRAELTLRGDANQLPDDETYRVDSADRVFFSAPMLGYAVAWLGTPAGLLSCAALAGVALLALRRPRADGRTGHGPIAGVAVVALAVGGWGGASSRATTAYFTDAGTAASGSIASHTLAPPVSASCSSTQVQATVSWPADPRYDYAVVLRRISNGALVSTRQVTGAGNSTTYSGLSDFGLVIGAGTVDFQVEITSKLAVAPTWTSTTARTYSAIRVVAVVVGSTATCTT
jgi:signal peptidase I